MAPVIISTSETIGWWLTDPVRRSNASPPVSFFTKERETHTYAPSNELRRSQAPPITGAGRREGPRSMLPEDEKLKINMTFPLAFEPGSRYCAASLIFIVTYIGM